jgi:hypothetical protein
MLKNFKLGKFKIVINPLEDIILPKYKGSTFRGGFGNCFRKIVCLNRRWDCRDCILKEKCIYSYIFETPLPRDAELQKKNTYIPHPFILEPPLDEKELFKKGENISFDLILIGKAIDYLPYFIFTFNELGKIGIGKGRGKYFLEKVENYPHSSSNGKYSEKVRVVYHGKDEVFLSEYQIITGKDIEEISNHINGDSRITLDFLTPTRIKYQDRLISQLEFPVLIKNLLRRISSLSYFHSDNLLNLDYQELIKEAENIKTIDSELFWYDWERYSTRQSSKMKLGGFKGRVSFQGKEDGLLKRYLPLIVLGEYIHIGKGTSFGLGKYRICR